MRYAAEEVIAVGAASDLVADPDKKFLIVMKDGVIDKNTLELG